jgi:hypothetical protein
MPSYTVNRRGVAQARRLIKAKRYVLNSNWGNVQPKAADENAFLGEHTWQDYAGWFLGLTEGLPRRLRPDMRSCTATSAAFTEAG